MLVPGRRKGKVHELFDRLGPQAAWTLGLKLKLKENTLRSWFGQWQRSGKTTKSVKPRSKAAAKAAPSQVPDDATTAGDPPTDARAR